MAKITSKAALVFGTNIKLHIADKGGTDISITKAGSIYTIASAAAAFTTSSETAGIVNRAVVIGDIIRLSHTTNAQNEGLLAKVTAVTATSITADTAGITQTAGQGGLTEIAGSDINVTTIKKTYQFLAASGLSFVDGVQGLILASKLVDAWDATDLDKYDRVFASIEPRAKSIASINGWEPHDLSTLNSIRDTALEIRPTSTGTATKVYCLFRSTGNAHAGTDQMTFWFSGDADATAPNIFVMAGYANQLALLYDYNNGNPIDYRGNWYTRLAVEFKTIIMETTNAQFAEIYPISAANALDPKLLVGDATIAGGGIYANIDYNLNTPQTGLTATLATGTANITVASTSNLRVGMPLAKTAGTGVFGVGAYILSITNSTVFVASVNHSTAGAITFDAGIGSLEVGLVNALPYTFYGHVDSDNQTNESVHAKLNYLWRQTTNVNAQTTPTKRGDKQFPLSTFSGDVFTIKAYDYLYKASQRNFLRLVDNSAVIQQWPTAYTLTINAAALAVGGTMSVIHEDSFGTAGAVYLKNDIGVDQKDIPITSSKDITIAYSTYTTGGHTANTPLALRLTYNRPNFIEPDSKSFLFSADGAESIQPTPDPSYTVA